MLLHDDVVCSCDGSSVDTSTRNQNHTRVEKDDVRPAAENYITEYMHPE